MHTQPAAQAPCRPSRPNGGRVALVGAGPGDPDLITVKALRLLKEAVVGYDRLVHSALLDACHAGTERVDVGKMPGCHKVVQALIAEILVEYARRGLAVVRLKEGDPFVFGRGGEEALALAEAEVPFEVVPGVSSAVAVPAYAGIPVTHRGIASHDYLCNRPSRPQERGHRLAYDSARRHARPTHGAWGRRRRPGS